MKRVLLKDAVTNKTTKPIRDEVVFDLETTGLTPAVSQIIEIGAARYRFNHEKQDFEKVGIYSTYVANYKHADCLNEWVGGAYESYKIHRIPVKAVTPQKNGKTEGLKGPLSALMGFAEFAKDSCYVAQNAVFDTKFIQYTLYRDSAIYKSLDLNEKSDFLKVARKGLFMNRYIDTLSLSKLYKSNIDTEFESISLDEASDYIEPVVEYVTDEETGELDISVKELTVLSKKKLKNPDHYDDPDVLEIVVRTRMDWRSDVAKGIAKSSKDNLGTFTKRMNVDYDADKHHSAVYDTEITADAHYKVMKILDVILFDKPTKLSDIGININKSDDVEYNSIYEATNYSPISTFNQQKPITPKKVEKIKEESIRIFGEVIFEDAFDANNPDYFISAIFEKNILDGIMKKYDE